MQKYNWPLLDFLFVWMPICIMVILALISKYIRKKYKNYFEVYYDYGIKRSRYIGKSRLVLIIDNLTGVLGGLLLLVVFFYVIFFKFIFTFGR